MLEEIELIEKILKEMTYVLNTNGILSPQDVETILDLTIEGREIISEKEFDAIVLYTKNDAIKAKDIRDNHLTFRQLRRMIYALQ